MSTNSSSILQAVVTVSEGSCLTSEIRRALEQSLKVSFDVSADSIGRVDVLSTTALDQVVSSILSNTSFNSGVSAELTTTSYLNTLSTALISNADFNTSFANSFFGNLTPGQLQSFIDALVSNKDSVSLDAFSSFLLDSSSFLNLSTAQTQQIVTKLSDPDVNLSSFLSALLESDSFSAKFVEELNKNEEKGKSSVVVDSNMKVKVIPTNITTAIGSFVYSIVGSGANVSGNYISSETASEVEITFPNASSGDSVTINWIKRI